MSCSCGDQSCNCVGKCHCPFQFCLCIACFNLRKSSSVKIKGRNEPFQSALGLSRDIQKYEGTGTNFNYDGEKFTQISSLINDELENEVVFIGAHNTNKKACSSSNAPVSEIVLSDSDCEVVFEIQNSSNDIEWIDVEEKRSSKKTLGDLNRKRNRKVKSVCSSSNITANSKCKSHKRSWSNRKSDQNDIIYGSNISSFLNHPQVSLVKHENISAQDYKNIHIKEGNVRENWFFPQKSSICGAFNAQENKSVQETSIANIENKILKSETNQYINENNDISRYFSQDSSDFNVYEGQENETTEKLLPNIRNNFPELKRNWYDSCEQYFFFKSGKQISRGNSGPERNGQNSEISVIFKYGENSASFGQRSDMSLPITTIAQANESSKKVGSQSSNFPRNHHEKLSDFSAYDYEERNIEKSMQDHNLFPHSKFHEQNKDSDGLVTTYPTLTEHKYSEKDFFHIVDDDESSCKHAKNEKEVSVWNLSYPSSSNSCYNHQETYNHSLENVDGTGELSYKAARNKHVSFENSCNHDSLEICNNSIGNTHAIRKRIHKRIKKEDAGAKICTINEIIHKKAPVRWIRRRRRRRKRTVKKKKKAPIKKIKKSDCVKGIKKIKVEIKTEIKKEIKKEYE